MRSILNLVRYIVGGLLCYCGSRIFFAEGHAFGIEWLGGLRANAVGIVMIVGGGLLIFAVRSVPQRRN